MWRKRVDLRPWNIQVQPTRTGLIELRAFFDFGSRDLAQPIWDVAVKLFCSRPAYLEIFDHIDANVLTPGRKEGVDRLLESAFTVLSRDQASTSIKHVHLDNPSVCALTATYGLATIGATVTPTDTNVVKWDSVPEGTPFVSQHNGGSSLAVQVLPADAETIFRSLVLLDLTPLEGGAP